MKTAKNLVALAAAIALLPVAGITVTATCRSNAAVIPEGVLGLSANDDRLVCFLPVGDAGSVKQRC